jgi:putative ABC transport system permease protein
LRDLATAYPNITAIGVRDAIGRVTAVLESVAGAITYGALASLLTGGIVLVGAAAASERSRRYEAAILKALGASRAHILMNFSLRSLIMGLAAGLVAIGAGALAGWAVISWLMELEYQFFFGSALMVILAGIVLTMGAGLFFSLRALSTRPAQTLRSRE